MAGMKYEDLNKDSVLAGIVEHLAKARGVEEKSKEVSALRKEVEQQYGDLSPQQMLMQYAAKNNDRNASPDKLTADEQAVVGEVLLRAEKLEEKREVGFGRKLWTALGGDLMDRPEIKITDKEGKERTLEPKEYLAYVKTAERGTDGKITQDVSDWAKVNKVTFTGEGQKYPVTEGTQFVDYYIETPEGYARTVNAKKDMDRVTKPLEGASYGAMPGYKVGDKDGLDAYFSTKAVARMQKGESPTAEDGKVYVMQQMNTDKYGNKTIDELKVGVGFESLQAFQAAQASTWKDPSKFSQLNEGKYVELTQEQFARMKNMIVENPKLTVDQFVTAEKTRDPRFEAQTLTPIAAPAAAAAAAAAMPAPAPAPEVAPAPAPAPVAPPVAVTAPELKLMGMEAKTGNDLKFSNEDLALQKQLKDAELDIGNFKDSKGKPTGLDGKFGGRTSDAAKMATYALIAEGVLKPNEKGEVSREQLTEALKDPKNIELVKKHKDDNPATLKEAAQGKLNDAAKAETTALTDLKTKIAGASGYKAGDDLNTSVDALSNALSRKDQAAIRDAALKLDKVAYGAVIADGLNQKDVPILEAMQKLQESLKGKGVNLSEGTDTLVVPKIDKTGIAAAR